MRLPVKPAGDHQVQDQPELVLKPDGNSLSHSPQLAHCLAPDGFQRRLECPEQERAVDSHPLQPLSDYAPDERLDVDHDVREFRHGVEWTFPTQRRS